MEARKILAKDFDKNKMITKATEENYIKLIDIGFKPYSKMYESLKYNFLGFSVENKLMGIERISKKELIEFVEYDSEPITYNSEKGWDF